MQKNNLTIQGLKIVIIFYSIMAVSSISILFLMMIPSDYNIYFMAIAGILTLVSLLGLYIGIRKIYAGSKEYGEAHVK
jgi:hypothetical protein